jgi:hypothetical protein
VKPEPLRCPECQQAFELQQDEDGDWLPDSEWWFHRGLGVAFLCSRRCYLKADARYVPRETPRRKES